MGNTYKDREKMGRPRVPEWARPKPSSFHKLKNKKDPEIDYIKQWKKGEWEDED